MSLNPIEDQYKAAADAKITGWTEAARMMIAELDDGQAYSRMCMLMETLVPTASQAQALLALALMHLAQPPVDLAELSHLDFEPGN